MIYLFLVPMRVDRYKSRNDVRMTYFEQRNLEGIQFKYY